MEKKRGLWESFEKSGKISDYLEYRRAVRDEEKRRGKGKPENEKDQSSL